MQEDYYFALTRDYPVSFDLNTGIYYSTVVN
jgi:hypothetical protein